MQNDYFEEFLSQLEQGLKMESGALKPHGQKIEEKEVVRVKSARIETEAGLCDP